MTIKFGTDGWRDIIAQNYTFENVARCASAVACYLSDKNRKKMRLYKKPPDCACFKTNYRGKNSGVIIGYDTRFLSGAFAEQTAKTISSYGIPVFLSDRVSPTPAVSWAILQKKCCGGVVITASHNPPEYNGFKFKAEYGGSGLPEIMCAIEKKIKYNGAPSKKPDNSIIKHADIVTPYIEQLRGFVDLERISKLNLKIAVDSMFGATSNLFNKFFKHSKNKLTLVRNYDNPGFEGCSPEPLDKNLKPLKDAVRANGADIGFAFDGDGDRIGAYDKFGNFLSSHHIFLILLWHLTKNRRMSGSVVKTFSTTQKVKLLAEKLGCDFIETPIGFKYICELMLSKDILIGGEESGGIGIKSHMPERDGMLCALLMLEAMAYSQMEIHEIMEEIYESAGRFFYERIDLKLKNIQTKNSVMRKLTKGVKTFNNKTVSGIKTLDGVKYLFADSSWILFRPSGTEPLLRVYAETSSRKNTLDMLNEGVRLVNSLQ